MSISIREFQVAMETYGAKRLYDCLGSRYDIPVPRFRVGGVDFIHSGSYYIVPKESDVPQVIMDKAMAEVGEEHPGGENFWYGEIHSIKGMLTLAAILDGKYSKERVDELTNETYKKLLDCPTIKNNVKVPLIEELKKLLVQYHNMVNPFGNSKLKLKEPIQYLNDVKIALLEDGNFRLTTNFAQTSFTVNKKILKYKSSVRHKKRANIDMIHYYKIEDDGCFKEEVQLFYEANTASWSGHPNDIGLRISLKDGLAYEVYQDEQYFEPVTDEQIETMIKYLKISIRKIKKEIISHMIEQ